MITILHFEFIYFVRIFLYLYKILLNFTYSIRLTLEMNRLFKAFINKSCITIPSLKSVK